MEFEKIFNIGLIVSILVILYLCIQKFKSAKNTNPVEKFNMDKLFINEHEPSSKVEFNYGSDKIRPIDRQFMKEQEHGVAQHTWYPNTWIERIDESGNPVYGQREEPDTEHFIESKARFSYDFNSPRIAKMDGIADPDNFIDGKGRTLHEVYNESFVDYKKLAPQKKKIEGTVPSKNAGSNLAFIEPDNWIYENEKPENGGKFAGGVYGADPFATGSISNSHATFL